MLAKSNDLVLTPHKGFAGSPDHSIGRPVGLVISNDVMTGRIKNIYYVYFLKLSNGNIYKGSTSDLKRRMEEHNTGKVKSTHPFKPVLLLGYEAYLLKSDAQRREKFLKTTEGRRLLKQQHRDILNE